MNDSHIPYPPMNFLRNGVALVLAFACGQALANTVRDVAPNELAGLLAKQETTVVQFTSSDPKCRYCIGADRAFDRIARRANDPQVAYVRVSWPVWHKTPDFGGLDTIYGVPEQIVYQRTKLIGRIHGSPKNGRAFLASVQQIRDNPDKKLQFPPPTVEAAPAPTPATPMSAEEEKLSRQLARKDLIQATLATCSQAYPQMDGSIQEAYSAWLAPQKAALDRAALVMLERSSRADAEAMRAIVSEEHAILTSWARKDVKVGTGSTPTEADCGKMMRSLGTLPAIVARGAAKS